MNNSLLFRLFIFVKHSFRIAFLPWPKYTFNDLTTAQDAIDGPRFEAMSTRFKESTSGQKLLKDRPMLSFGTMNWKYLSELPVHTIGYCVWHHFVSNDIFEEPDLGRPRIKWNNEGEYIKPGSGKPMISDMSDLALGYPEKRRSWLIFFKPDNSL